MRWPESILFAYTDENRQQPTQEGIWMNMQPPGLAPRPDDVYYPQTDGKPVAENTLQLQWIITLVGNLQALFANRPDVFVFGDQFWYPVRGRPDIVQAPDAYVVFGRPKGHRPSWLQWEEGDVPMTVVFEVRSPSNTDEEMAVKRLFYEQYGVEEYYDFDPERNQLAIWIRRRRRGLRLVESPEGFTSPRLGIRFDLSGPEMVVHGPDGARFLTFEELEAARVQAEQLARAEKKRANAERRRANTATRRAEAESQRADAAEQRAAAAAQHSARLAELSRKVRRGQATGAEIEELARLEQDSLSTQD
jgi:Uma2 family endonuclease